MGRRAALDSLETRPWHLGSLGAVLYYSQRHHHQAKYLKTMSSRIIFPSQQYDGTVIIVVRSEDRLMMRVLGKGTTTTMMMMQVQREGFEADVPLFRHRTVRSLIYCMFLSPVLPRSITFSYRPTISADDPSHAVL
jgi:hypothetical protein